MFHYDKSVPLSANIYFYCFRPRGGVGSEPPQSSDSDEYSTSHGHQQQQVGHGHGQGQVDVLNVPKVHVSGPSNSDESSSIING